MGQQNPKKTEDSLGLCLVDRNGVYTRYSMCDWDASFVANVHLSEKERAIGERVRADSWRVVNGTEKTAVNRQCSNTKKLGHYNTTQYNTIQNNTMQNNTIQYN